MMLYGVILENLAYKVLRYIYMYIYADAQTVHDHVYQDVKHILYYMVSFRKIWPRKFC